MNAFLNKCCREQTKFENLGHLTSDGAQPNRFDQSWNYDTVHDIQ